MNWLRSLIFTIVSLALLVATPVKAQEEVVGNNCPTSDVAWIEVLNTELDSVRPRITWWQTSNSLVSQHYGVTESEGWGMLCYETPEWTAKTLHVTHPSRYGCSYAGFIIDLNGAQIVGMPRKIHAALSSSNYCPASLTNVDASYVYDADIWMPYAHGENPALWMLPEVMQNQITASGLTVEAWFRINYYGLAPSDLE